MEFHQLKTFLDKRYEEYAREEFIAKDPISIPYRFSIVQDIEISAFFASIFAWGRRDIIIAKTNQLMAMMDESPYDFIKNFEQKDLKKFKDFKHRTFNFEDLCFFLTAFQQHFKVYDTLEKAFAPIRLNAPTIESSLNHFFDYITSIAPIENRTFKHLSAPKKSSACKRLCMYHRWMVRNDSVDFGLWKNVQASQLIMPLDVHVLNSAFKLNLIPQNSKANWQTACLLTQKLKEIDANDPVKYDFSLFGMGVFEKNTNPQ
jgi:uncharacterized protein (TIGR02757 family)